MRKQCDKSNFPKSGQKKGVKGILMGSLSFPDTPRSRSLLDSLAFFTHRCFHSLSPIESLEQARTNEANEPHLKVTN